MRVKIGDVAKAAGVSMKTVSRVMNNESSVKPETREHIQAIAKQMNYRPDPFARSLAGRRSYLIGLLYDNPSSNYIMEILTGVVAACDENHYGVVLHPLSCEHPDFVPVVERLIRTSKLDGLILTPPITDHEQLLDLLDSRSVNYSCVSPRFGTGRIGVYLDEHQAVLDLMQHLFSLGHTRIAHIKGYPSHGAAEWRLNGYRSALRRAGIAYEPDLVQEGRFTFESGVAATERLLSLPSPPTAIFAGNDDTAAGVMRVILERGIRIPEEMSVCGFDNLPMSRQIFPALTTVHQPTRAMGHTVTVQLLQSLRARHEASMIKMPYELIFRESTGPAPTRK
jgi:LacI family transcriptional regulator